MELSELERRLGPFCRMKYDDADVRVFDVVKMPGHAGFSYGFSVAQRDRVERWFMRLPPPNVQWRGTADVLRQVAVLNALDRTSVPHCSVRWSGAELEWFGCPYFVVPRLEGDVLRLAPGEWGASLSAEQLFDVGKHAMTALAEVHKLDWRSEAQYLGAPLPLEDDVTRWDRFYERAADPERLARAPEVRRKLLAALPSSVSVGIFHGDFQTANLLCSQRGELLAVIDWELTGVGATLNDVGWICTFSDVAAWDIRSRPPMFLDPDTLVQLYAQAHGGPLSELAWFRALAAYKFAIISGFNLSLHRRGKRHDPAWEVTSLSMSPLLDRALELLG
jgi:aminoglycoside phosphotransferase (APT) family kinase protein